MKKILDVLIDGICEAHAMALGEGRFAPKYSKEMGRLVTHCNESVNYVAKKFGYFKFDLTNSTDPFDARLANEQHDIMESSEEWTEVKMPEAQKFANEGALVIGSLKNPKGPGHVIVLRPGMAQHSGTWGQLAPKCLNVGGSVFLDKKASWAFRTVPTFFVLNQL